MKHAVIGRPQAPATTERDYPTCGRCSGCHAGRQWGGDEMCKKRDCKCHHKGEGCYQ